MADAAPYYQVLGTGRSFIIADGSGKSVNGKVYACHHTAQARAHRLENETRFAGQRRVRACMCCGIEFASQGAHNRLCGTCRRLD